MRLTHTLFRPGNMTVRILLLVAALGGLGFVIYHHTQKEKAPVVDNTVVNDPANDSPLVFAHPPVTYGVGNGQNPNLIVVNDKPVQNPPVGQGIQLGPILKKPFPSRERLLISNSGKKIQEISDKSLVWGESVNQFVISPDSKWVIAALKRPKGRVILINLQTGEKERTLIESLEYITDLAISPDGKLLAVADKSAAGLWDIASGKKLVQFPREVNFVAFAPDGQFLATLRPKSLEIRLVKNGRAVAVIPREEQHDHMQKGLLWSSDGKWIVYTSDYHVTIQLLDVSTLKTRRLIRMPKSIHAMHLTPDGSKLLISTLQQPNLQVFELATNRRLPPIPVNFGFGANFDISPQGNFLVAAGKAQLLNAKTGQVMGGLNAKTGASDELVFTPDGTALIQLLNNSLTLRKLHLPAEEWSLASAQKAEQVALSPDATTLAVSNEDSTFLLNAKTGRPIRTLKNQSSRALAFSPDGKTLVTADASKSQIQFWNVEDGQSKATLTFENSIDILRYSPDGTTLACVDFESIILVDLKSKATTTLKGHWGIVSSLMFSVDGKMLVSGADDATIRIWDVEKKTSSKPVLAHEGEGMRVAISPDGSRIASAASEDDGTIAIWDISGKEMMRIDNAYKESVLGLLFSKDGNALLCMNSVGRSKVWDVRKGALISEVLPDWTYALKLSFPTTGENFVSWQEYQDDLQAKVWNGAKLLQRAQGLRGMNPPPAPESESLSVSSTLPPLKLPMSLDVRRRQFSADGRWLMIAGVQSFSEKNGGYLILWDAVKKQAVRTIYTGQKQIHQAIISPNGKYLASLQQDHMERSLKIFESASGKLLHTLSQKDWYLSDLKFYPDGEKLVGVVTQGKTFATVWSSSTGKVIHKFPTSSHFSLANKLCISPDGTQIAFNSAYKSVSLWDATTFSPQHVWKGFDDIGQFDFSPDGKTLAVEVTADSGRDIFLWNTQTGKVIGRFACDGDHKIIKFTPDGKMLFVGGDGYYDIKTGKRLAKSKAGEWFVDYSADGKIMITTSDRIFMPDFFNVPLQKLAKFLQARGVHAGISRDDQQLLTIKLKVDGRRSLQALHSLKELQEPFGLIVDSYSTWVDDEALKSIGSMTNLKELTLNDCERITDAGIAHLKNLKNLEVLKLNETKVTDKALQYLSDLKKLRHLEPSESMTEQALNTLQKQLPKLKIDSDR